jgi:dihydroxy-acid dehydratase
MPIDDAQEATLPKITPNDLRSRKWFNNPEMTALYLERYLNYGLPRD